MEPIVSLSHVNLYFKNNFSKTPQVIFKNLEINFAPEKFHFLMGNNGSGKTLFCYLLCGLSPKHSGKITYHSSLGKNTQERMGKICLLTEEFLSLEDLSARQFINYTMGLYGVKSDDEKIDYWLDYFELRKHIHKKIKNYSKGMRKKLMLLVYLVLDFAVYIFDEPLSGLDYTSQNKFLEILEQLKKQGKTIFLISHFPQIFKTLIDESYFIKDGRIHPHEI